MKIIDCHTHLQTKELINEYNLNGNYAISIKALKSLIGNGNKFYRAVNDFDNIFIVECIDANKSIRKQLNKIEKRLKRINKIVGIKIYLGYQSIYANDEKLYPIYYFALKHNLTIVFHCGVGSENLKDGFGSAYADASKIEDVAKYFPSVKFVASHFNEPDFESCANLVLNYDNVFTDISGGLENVTNKPSDIVVAEYVNKIEPLIKKYKDTNLYKKVMFGTDFFGAASGFGFKDEYVLVLKKLFKKECMDNLLFINCLNAYPKIKQIIKY